MMIFLFNKERKLVINLSFFFSTLVFFFLVSLPFILFHFFCYSTNSLDARIHIHGMERQSEEKKYMASKRLTASYSKTNMVAPWNIKIEKQQQKIKNLEVISGKQQHNASTHKITKEKRECFKRIDINIQALSAFLLHLLIFDPSNLYSQT